MSWQGPKDNLTLIELPPCAGGKTRARSKLMNLESLRCAEFFRGEGKDREEGSATEIERVRGKTL